MTIPLSFTDADVSDNDVTDADITGNDAIGGEALKVRHRRTRSRFEGGRKNGQNPDDYLSHEGEETPKLGQRLDSVRKIPARRSPSVPIKIRRQRISIEVFIWNGVRSCRILT